MNLGFDHFYHYCLLNNKQQGRESIDQRKWQSVEQNHDDSLADRCEHGELSRRTLTLKVTVADKLEGKERVFFFYGIATLSHGIMCSTYSLYAVKSWIR